MTSTMSGETVLCVKSWKYEFVNKLQRSFLLLLSSVSLPSLPPPLSLSLSPSPSLSLLHRDALVLEVSEKEAKEHFIHKLQEARRNAWFTSLNWYVHGLAKDNRA